MRDKPITGKEDKNYSIKLEDKANLDYEKYFKEKVDDVIFLNGRWGSGKTSYLNIVLERDLVKNKFYQNRQKIIKTIDLWRVTSNQKTSEICYRTVFPVTGFLSKYIFFIIFLLLSGMASYLSKFQISDSHFFNNITAYLLFTSGIMSGLIQVMGRIDYDAYYLKLLKLRTSGRLIKKDRIIIIDDFDRISPDRQEELYKIFNLITNKKIQFVFLGEYSIIQKNENSYLQKIIDRRIELPYELSPTNYWTDYFEKIVKIIENQRDDSLSNTEKVNLDKLKQELIKNNRTLREKIMFEKYVDEFLFHKDRYDKVNIDQQLTVIYLYLFCNDHYNVLISQIEVLLKPHSDLGSVFAMQSSEDKASYLSKLKKIAIKYFDGESELTETTELILDVLLMYKSLIDNYAREYSRYDDFKLFYPNYLINYNPINLSGKNIRNMIREPWPRERIIKKIKEINNSDISKYISRNQLQLTEIEKSNLFNMSVEFILHLDNKYPYDYHIDGQKIREEISTIISLGLRLNEAFDINKKRETKKYLHDNYLFSLDISAQIQFYRYYLHLSVVEIVENQSQVLKLINNSDQLYELSYPENIFHYIFQKNRTFSEKELNLLIELPDNNFYHFLLFYQDHFKNDNIFSFSNFNEEEKKMIKDRYNQMDTELKEFIILN